jgi:hypothetical protein
MACPVQPFARAEPFARLSEPSQLTIRLDRRVSLTLFLGKAGLSACHPGREFWTEADVASPAVEKTQHWNFSAEKNEGALRGQLEFLCISYCSSMT